MKIFSTILFLIAVLQINAQQNIADAKQYNEGETITVSGIVTNGDELGPIRYLQDATAGLAVYDTKLGTVQRGDSITVTGQINSYNNLFEITKTSSFTIHSSGNQLPAPKIIHIDEIGEDYEGQLIEIKNIKIEGAGSSFAGNKNYNFSDGTKTGVLRIGSTSPIVGQVIPSGEITLVAICSQYSYSSPIEGYQLLPRTMDDFISGSLINFTSPVATSEINKNGFTLSWSTDADASSEVLYGFNNDRSSWINSASGSSISSTDGFDHLVELSGFDAGSIIYAITFSAIGTDTTFSSMGVYATESNSTGEIIVYFNTELNQDISTGTLAKTVDRALEDTLINYINRAEKTIDLCIYNMNNSGLSDMSGALNSAFNRGVKIRFITCESTIHSAVDEFVAGIPVIERPEIAQGGIMHNKFAIFDANSSDPNKIWVWSGSTNLTNDQIKSDANNMVFIQDQSLALAYKIEFEEMWGSTGDQPNTGNAKFGADKTNNTPHEFIIGGKRVEQYFSPSDGTNQKIIDAINTAENDLNVETMLITRSDIAFAIKEAYERGTEVHVITNSSGSNTTTVNDILSTALPAGKFVFDGLARGTLHHKLAIIDANYAASDPQVITGSHNWSNSANDRNDENTLIIHDAVLANEYLQQFAYRFAENGGDLVVSAESIEFENVMVYPNPTSDKIIISSTTPLKKVQLFSATGTQILVINKSQSHEAEINLISYQPGLYILKIETDNKQFNSYKIIKK